MDATDTSIWNLLESKKHVLVSLWRNYINGQMEDRLRENSRRAHFQRTEQGMALRIMVSRITHAYVRANWVEISHTYFPPALKLYDVDLMLFAEFIASEMFARFEDRASELIRIREKIEPYMWYA